MKYKIAVKDKNFIVEVSEAKNGVAQVIVDGEAYRVEFEKYLDKQESQNVQIKAEYKPEIKHKIKEVQEVQIVKPMNNGNLCSYSVIKAPIPGLIIDVKVKKGDSVKVGQIVAVMDAMKMENNILSNFSGIIKEVMVQNGMSINTGDAIVAIEQK